MYKILFVEDEDIIRTGLKKIVSDAGIKFEATFEASCGKDALEIIKKHRPEIVVTDIIMPKMDGIELISQCRDLGLNISFIIISGYGEFAYAQKAIAFGVTNYLLKPTKKMELIDTINGIISKLNSDKEKQEKINELQQESIKQILKGKYKPEEAHAIFNNVGLEFLKKSFIVLSYCMHETDNAMHEMVRKMVYSEVRKPFEPIISHTFPYKYTIILFTIDDPADLEIDRLLNHLETKILNIGRTLNLNLYAGISNISNDISQIHNLVLQSENALDYRLFYYQRKLFYYNDLLKANSLVHIPDIYSEAVINAAAHGKISETIDSIDNLFRFLLKIEYLTPHFIISTFEELLHEVKKAIIKNTDSNLENTSDNGMQNIESIINIYRSSYSINNLAAKIKEAFLSAARNPANGRTGYFSNAIDCALKYIEENYKKDLSVDRVSNYICMSPNYFSSLFKSKTGCSFTSYLQKIRVEKSKQLLSDPKNKIFEIAEMVGFVNNKYFFKIFKKETGLTPGEYRNMY